MQELEAMEKRFAETRVEMGARLAGLEVFISQLQRQLHEQREKCRQHTGMAGKSSCFCFCSIQVEVLQITRTGISLCKAKQYMTLSMGQLKIIIFRLRVVCYLRTCLNGRHAVQKS